jgi:hypothetical protein
MTPWRAIEILCRALDARLSGSDLQAFMDEPQRVMQTASRHLVMPALIGLLETPHCCSLLDDDIVEAVTLVHDLNLERNQICLREIQTLAATLNTIDVEPVLLKGAAALVDGLYPDPGWRILTDIDVLVPDERLAECAALLESQGWDTTEWSKYLRSAENPGLKHYPRLFHPEFLFGVELHRHLARPDDVDLLPARDLLAQASPRRLGDTQVRLPSATHRLMHNLINSQLSDRHHAHGTVSLRQLFEWVNLRRRDDARIDWTAMQRDLRGAEATAALQGYCALAAMLFDQTPPTALGAATDTTRYPQRVRANSLQPRRMQLAAVLRTLAAKVSAVARDPSKALRLGSPVWWRHKRDLLGLGRPREE